MAERKEQIKKFILANLSGKRRFNRILDYGGDRGQFIPDDISDERYVYEVSVVTPVPGVTLVDDIDSVGNDTFDVVILSMVLEHVSDPHVILNKIHEILAPDGYLVLEVPYEPFKYKNWFGNKTENYLNKLANSPEFISKAIDLYSTLFRIKFRYIPPLGFVKLHEHINFFSESSLHSLFQLNNFSVISIERHYQDTKSFINDSLLCLVKVEK
ncbi:class I SAM-dependent methyltransferase [Methanolacinia petrolearia]|uniref:class I SAM-dependent methyltransferase n=1 Tax=Methanolacinia petrolearia TaxID=54120 RepID=UPI003BAD5492